MSTWSKNLLTRCHKSYKKVTALRLPSSAPIEKVVGAILATDSNVYLTDVPRLIWTLHIFK